MAAKLIGVGLISLAPVPGRADDAPETLARLVADRAMKDFPQPPPFDWGEGVLMAGMMRAGQALHEPRYIDFVRRWADHWRQFGVDRLLAGDAEKGLKGYCGQWGPGFPLMLLYEQTRDDKYLQMARTIAGFILNEATRTKEGGLGHWHGNQQLWVDTLYMHGPLLAHLYRADRRSEYLDDAVKQLTLYADQLQDEKTGLFYHMYDDPKGEHSPMFWARGNGWVAMTMVEVLKVLPEGDQRRTLERRFERQMDGLRRTQDAQSGLWHTVIDHPETYTETSASAMILSAFLEGDRAGLLKSSIRETARCAWSGLSLRVDEWGWVFDVSGGTRPGELEEYANKVTGTYTWGTGAFLIAACALIGG